MSESRKNDRRPQYPSTRIELLRRLRDGVDKQAWGTFTQLYPPLVYQYARAMGLQDADAQDVTQNVFISVSRAIKQFDYDAQRGRFRGWLGTITWREIRRFQLKKERHVPTVDGELGLGLLGQIDQQAEGTWVDAFNGHVYRCAVDRVRPEFDEPTWRAFQLTWEQNRTPGDVANQVRQPTAWVYKAKFRVLQRLREETRILASDTMLRAGVGAPVD